MIPVYIRHNGRVQSMAAWAKELSITRQCLSQRFKAGWTVAEALTSDPAQLAEIRHRKAIGAARHIAENRKARGTMRNGYTGPIQPTFRFDWEGRRQPKKQPPGKRLPSNYHDRIAELARRVRDGEELFGEADLPERVTWGAWE